MTDTSELMLIARRSYSYSPALPSPPGPFFRFMPPAQPI